MTLDELLATLTSREIQLQRSGDRLRCIGPRGAIDAALSAALTEHKQELLELLAAPTQESGTLSERSALPLAARDRPLPLSFSQERMWFWDQMMGPNSVYNIAVPLPLLNQELDFNALRTSLSTLVARHDILRTVFRREGGRDCAQVIKAPAAIEPEFIALSRHSEPHERAQYQEELRTVLAREATRSFDLSEGPLFRAVVVCIGPRTHVVLLLMHHIISDGWSNQVLIRELITLYSAARLGREIALPALEAQYADFAAWQRGSASAEDRMRRQLDYWVTQLDGLPPLLSLPYDRQRPAVSRYVGHTLSFDVPASTARRLRALSSDTQTSLFTVLLAVFALRVSLWSQRTDVVIGSPLANRRHPQLENMIGPCLNTLALRTRVDLNQSVKSYLHQVRRTVLDAFEHQDVPFEQIVNGLRVQRSLSYEPLVQVGFLLKIPPLGEVQSKAGLTFDQAFGFDIRSVVGYSKLDLTVMTKEDGERIVGWFEYSTDLFDASTIEAMMADYTDLLEEVAGLVERAADAQMTDLQLIHRTRVPARDVNFPSADNAVSAKAPFVPPRTASEKRVAAVWAKTLSIEPIGALDNFFALGGNSLMVMDVVSQLQDGIQVPLPLKIVFETQTVERLAERLDALATACEEEHDESPALELLAPA